MSGSRIVADSTVTKCGKYSHSFYFLRNFFEKKNADLLVRFLKENSSAFTFRVVTRDVGI